MTLRVNRSSRMVGIAMSICPSRYPRAGLPDDRLTDRILKGYLDR
jgi:hypothetical protein